MWGRIYQGKAGSKGGKVTTRTGRGNTPHFLTTHTQIFYCKVQCEGDKWKKYKPTYTYVGYDQRDYTLVMDDFISRFSHPSLPLFSCAVMISYEEFTHTFVPVIVLLCSTMRISSAHYRIYKTFSSLCPFALFLCWDIMYPCLKTVWKFVERICKSGRIALFNSARLRIIFIL